MSAFRARKTTASGHGLSATRAMLLIMGWRGTFCLYVRRDIDSNEFGDWPENIVGGLSFMISLGRGESEDRSPNQMQ